MNTYSGCGLNTYASAGGLNTSGSCGGLNSYSSCGVNTYSGCGLNTYDCRLNTSASELSNSGQFNSLSNISALGNVLTMDHNLNCNSIFNNELLLDVDGDDVDGDNVRMSHCQVLNAEESNSGRLSDQLKYGKNIRGEFNDVSGVGRNSNGEYFQ